MEDVRAYLDPTAPIAADAIVVDDPKLAMDLAVAVTDSPRMSNLSHGLWGYHGSTADGSELTIQSLGIGGPSAAVVIAELAEFGVTKAVRIGSCIALGSGLDAGSSLIATAFEPADATGAALAAGQRVRPDAALTEALARATGVERRGAVRSADLISGGPLAGEEAAALDLGSAGFAAAAARVGITFAAGLIVARSREGAELSLDELHEALMSLGKQAVTALNPVAQAP